MNINEIKKILPHRYPFLLVDKIIEIESGKRVVGIKNVTANEPFFQGHFPDYPVMPGVLIVEALAQVSAFLVMSEPANQDKIGVLAGIDQMRFKKQVFPGDALTLRAELVAFKRGVGKANVCAMVEGETAAAGTVMFAITEAATQ